MLHESPDLHLRGKDLLTLREVLTKRHCILKEVLGLRTKDKETESQPDELWVARLML